MNRRTFLQVVGTAGAGAAGVGCVRGAPAAPAGSAAGPKFRVAVVGCGRWATAMTEVALQSGRARILATADPLLSRAAALRDAAKARSRWQHISACDDLESALADDRIDAVILGVPEHGCLEALRSCARRSLPVLARAPLAHSAQDSEAAAALVSDGRICVALPAEADAGLRALRARIEDGAIGTPRSVKVFVSIPGGRRERPGAPVEPAADVNWQKWCGPVGDSPCLPSLTQRTLPAYAGWRWHLRYGSGPMGGSAPHWLGALATLLPLQRPEAVYSIGRRVVLGSPLRGPDGAATSDAPDHQIACLRLPALDVTWEHRLVGVREKDCPASHAVISGDCGQVHLAADGGWTVSGKETASGRWLGPLNEAGVNSAVWANFLSALDAPATRASASLRIATDWVVWSMAAYQAQRTLMWDGRAFA